MAVLFTPYSVIQATNRVYKNRTENSKCRWYLYRNVANFLRDVTKDDTETCAAPVHALVYRRGLCEGQPW